MAWLILDPAISESASAVSSSFPWHVIATETFTIKDRFQETIHGTLKNEGSIILEGSAQLVIAR